MEALTREINYPQPPHHLMPHVFSAFLIIPRAFSLNGTPVPKPTHMVIYSYSSLQALAKEPNMIRA